MNPVISRIRIHPIKSLDGMDLQSATVGTRSLLHDREFAMLAPDGSFVNGKRTGRVNQLRATYDLPNRLVHFSARKSGPEDTFHLVREKEKIEAWLSHFFGMRIHFLQNKEGRLMDIPDTSCVTLLSTASLGYLSENGVGHSTDDLRIRFRASLEISGVPPFWEERLANLQGRPVPFRIGEVLLTGNSLRARCNVPPRDPHNGELNRSFVKKMTTARARNIPEWSIIGELPTFYHLSVDCTLPDSETGKSIKTGDELVIL
jgi:uncharacterized protein